MKRLLVLIAAAVLPACYCGTYDPHYYGYAYYDSYYSAYDATYVYGTYEPSGLHGDAIDLNAAAQEIAARAGDSYTHAGCVKATAQQATVNYVLDNCDARFGGKNINGRIAVALTTVGGQLRFIVSSSNLRVNGDDYVVDFTAAASSTGSQRVVTIESKSHAGEQVDLRLSTGTFSWEQGSGCITIDAQGTSQRKDADVTSTLAGYQRCLDQCPSAGTVTVRGIEGSFSGTFDGSDTLIVNAPNGSDRHFGLQCKD